MKTQRSIRKTVATLGIVVFLFILNCGPADGPIEYGDLTDPLLNLMPSEPGGNGATMEAFELVPSYEQQSYYSDTFGGQGGVQLFIEGAAGTLKTYSVFQLSLSTDPYNKISGIARQDGSFEVRIDGYKGESIELAGRFTIASPGDLKIHMSFTPY